MSCNTRITIIFFIFCSLFFIIFLKLFYWQVLNPAKVQNIAWGQYKKTEKIEPQRGDILSSDGLPFITTQEAFLLYASLPELKLSAKKIASKLGSILLPIRLEKIATTSAFIDKDEEKKRLEEEIESKLEQDSLMWTAIEHKLSLESKEEIENLNIQGLGFEKEQKRLYPEASMAAHILGFVGQDENGQDKGYFGLEGFYDLQLKGRTGILSWEKDAKNKPILFGFFIDQEKKNGSNLTLYLDKAIQYFSENKLEEAIKKYKAKSGYVVIMDPFTGGILAMASLPKYDPSLYVKYEKELYKNPIIADTFEPGSTFKIFVMAGAIDTNAVKPETKCDICDKPYKIDKYFIRTWNDKYYKDSSMVEVIQHSDNVGMVFAANKLGLDKFWDYLLNFGFGEATGIDLQEETTVYLKSKKQWSMVDMSTAAFGQGISITGIQLLRAAAAIANGGNLLEPHVVRKINSGEKEIEVKPKIIRKVIDEKTAEIIKEMMVNAVDEGEAKWTKLRGYKVAGKTGTAQIPIAGHYDEEKTIASFVGFAPADSPKFVMLVTLREPEVSPWASETAAPLFFSIAKDIFTYYGIQPE